MARADHCSSQPYSSFTRHDRSPILRRAHSTLWHSGGSAMTFILANQRYRPRMLRGWRPVLGVMLVLAAACGDTETAAPSSPSSTVAAPTASSATGTSPSRTIVPDVVVRDVSSGADVNVPAVAVRPDRPTLYWFWAPH